jgi:hypothetical protein
MTAPQPGQRAVYGSFTFGRLLMLLAFIFFLLYTLLKGGVFSGSGLGWFLGAGLSCMALAFVVP